MNKECLFTMFFRYDDFIGVYLYVSSIWVVQEPTVQRLKVVRDAILYAFERVWYQVENSIVILHFVFVEDIADERRG